jgi:hypothetical protein
MIIKLLESTPESCIDGMQQRPITAVTVPLSVPTSDVKHHRNFFEVRPQSWLVGFRVFSVQEFVADAA